MKHSDQTKFSVLICQTSKVFWLTNILIIAFSCKKETTTIKQSSPADCLIKYCDTFVPSNNVELVWRKTINQGSNIDTRRPFLTENELVFGTDFNKIIGIDRWTGQTKWVFDDPSTTNSPGRGSFGTGNFERKKMINNKIPLAFFSGVGLLDPGTGVITNKVDAFTKYGTKGLLDIFVYNDKLLHFGYSEVPGDYLNNLSILRYSADLSTRDTLIKFELNKNSQVGFTEYAHVTDNGNFIGAFFLDTTDTRTRFNIVSVNIESKKVNWRNDYYSDYTKNRFFRPEIFSHGNRIYAHDQKLLMCINQETGATIWRLEFSENSRSFDGKSILFLPDAIVYRSGVDNRFLNWVSYDGKLIKKVSVKGSQNSLVYYKGRIITSGTNKNNDSALLILDGQTGELIETVNRFHSGLTPESNFIRNNNFDESKGLFYSFDGTQAFCLKFKW
jgi:outer membrane protein assembly factor BamB